MKKLVLILGFLSALSLAPLTANARNFMRGTIDLHVSYSSLVGGTQPLIQIPKIDVHVSDDEKFCQLTLEGKSYSCIFAYSPGSYGTSDCKSKVTSKSKEWGQSYYNCLAAGGVALTTDSVIKILTGRIPSHLMENLRAKLIARSTIENQPRLEVYATLRSRFVTPLTQF